MNQIKGTLAHPGYSEVPVGPEGKITARINKWTMAQRAELKPQLARLIERIMSVKASPDLDLAVLFDSAEDEIAQICRLCTILPEGKSFDDLLWEDLPVLAQAIWETNIITEDGGGVAGKLTSLLAPLLAQVFKSGQMRALALAMAESQSKTASKQRQPDSPSSPGGGEPTPSASATA